MKKPFCGMRFRESDLEKLKEAGQDQSKLLKLAIPRFISEDGVGKVNPEWINAAYEEVFIEKP